jgi:cysteine desulfurase family protein (TIGR01976 family)
MSSEPLDINWVRSQFPALSGPHKDWALLDNAGGTAPLGRVIDRIGKYMSEVPVQTGASYAASVHAKKRLEEATLEIGYMIGSRVPGQIVFGPSATAMIGRVARAMAPRLTEGDEIIVTDVDHESNITPWLRLQDRGVKIRWWQVDLDTMRLQLDDLDELLSDKTRLVAVTHTSNILGRVEPVAEIASRAHAAGAQILVDGVGHVPHHSVDVRALGVDYYVFSLYKAFGPHHAVLYGKRDRLNALANLNNEHVSVDDIPYKLQPGGASYELTYGSAGIVDYLTELSGLSEGTTHARVQAAYEKITEYEEGLTRRLVDYLEARKDTRVYGPTMKEAESRVGIVSFSIAGRKSSEIPRLMEMRKVGVRFGDFNAKRLIDRLGLANYDGVVRVSLAHYNTDEEVSRVIHALDDFLD